MNHDDDMFVRVGVWLLHHEVIRGSRWQVDDLKFRTCECRFQEWLAADTGSDLRYYEWMKVRHFLHYFEVWLKRLLGDQLPPIADYRGTNSVHFPSLVSSRLYGTLDSPTTTSMDTTTTPLWVVESDSKQDPLLPVDLVGHTLCTCDVRTRSNEIAIDSWFWFHFPKQLPPTPIPVRMAFVPLRPQQAKFSQAVKQRDGECILTGATHPSILEAAHLHAHALCKNQAHAFYRANGITLHASLHCLFDTGHIGFYVAPDGVHLYVQAQDRATIVCLQEIAPRLTPNQLVPKFPRECIEYLVKRNTKSD